MTMSEQQANLAIFNAYQESTRSLSPPPPPPPPPPPAPSTRPETYLLLVSFNASLMEWVKSSAVTNSYIQSLRTENKVYDTVLLFGDCIMQRSIPG